MQAVIALLAMFVAVRTDAQCPQICDGNYNTGFGNQIMVYNTGVANTAIGQYAFGSASGNNNVAIGNYAFAGYTQNWVSDNVAIGSFALWGPDCSGCVAVGESSMINSLNGVHNTAIGISALAGAEEGLTGSYNTATGGFALYVNSSGSNNTADGIAALGDNTTGGSNTGLGQDALFSNTIGNTNTAVGSEALRNNTSGSNNIALGVNAGMNITTGSGNIDIGNSGVAGDASTIRIGGGRSTTKAFIWGINGRVVANGVPVLINPATSQLGTTTSSARFKTQIHPMGRDSDVILSMQPVSFRYRKEIADNSVPQFGLVAEDVEKVAPDLVVHDDDGKPYSVRYEAVNAMLLNEFLKEHRRNEQQEKEIGRQQTELDELRTALTEASAEIQKATHQLVRDRTQRQ